MAEYGVLEVARTGKVSLTRGAWTKGARPQFSAKNRSGPSTAGGAAPAAASDEPAVLAAVDSSGGDTYGVDDATGAGVWDVPVLDYNFGAPEVFDDAGRKFEPFTLSISVVDAPGVLNRLTGVLARRGYNIQSLAVGPAEQPGISRLTTVIPGTPETIRKLINQLNKMTDLIDIQNLSGYPFVDRELMLVKVRCDPSKRVEVELLNNIFRGRVCDVSMNTMTIEVTGDDEKLGAFQDLLQPYGILEVARTGRLALTRESHVDSKLLSVVESLDDI